jgi:hypothetical protein
VPGFGVEDVGREAGAFVGRYGPRVVGQHFERQLAAAKFARLLLGPLQQRLADALPATIVTHDDVVNIEQGFGGEGGETGEAVDQPDRLIAAKGQRAVEAGQIFQFPHQIGLGVSGKPAAATHWIACIVIEHCQPSFGNGLVLEVDRKNAKIIAHDKRIAT